LSGFIMSLAVAAVQVISESKIQWIVFDCMGFYFGTFLWLNAGKRAPPVWDWKFFSSLTSAPGIRTIALPILMCPGLWIAFLYLLILYSCCLRSALLTPALSLLAGGLIGQLAAWADLFSCESFDTKIGCTEEIQNGLVLPLSNALFILISFAAFWNMQPKQIFEYHDYERWLGPWDNPNIAGLIMAIGITLAIGRLVSLLRFARLARSDAKVNNEVRKIMFVILCVCIALLMGYRLLCTYSRGSWVGAILGLTFLATSAPNSEFRRCLHKKAFVIAVVILSVTFLAYWASFQTQGRLMHRVFSVCNQNDFSWRNRVAAWEGSLQMIASKPWFGVGSNVPEEMYKNYYLFPKFTETAAIELNDYLTLGAALGIPVLFCFGMYFWLSLTKKAKRRISTSFTPAEAMEPKRALRRQLDWFRCVLRAGAIVLAVGFWFDGGLFKLPAAAMFWILLELGREC